MNLGVIPGTEPGSSNHRFQLGFFGRASGRTNNGYWIADQVRDDAESRVPAL